MSGVLGLYRFVVDLCDCVCVGGDYSGFGYGSFFRRV